jgi:hypothetical protein
MGKNTHKKEDKWMKNGYFDLLANEEFIHIFVLT